jgi:hypothetical protein
MINKQGVTARSPAVQVFFTAHVRWWRIEDTPTPTLHTCNMETICKHWGTQSQLSFFTKGLMFYVLCTHSISLEFFCLTIISRPTYWVTKLRIYTLNCIGFVLFDITSISKLWER